MQALRVFVLLLAVTVTGFSLCRVMAGLDSSRGRFWRVAEGFFVMMVLGLALSGTACLFFWFRRLG